ncbi:MAG: hypothetical protein AB1656_24755 [Candidatus Omnitrophota bacterium]
MDELCRRYQENCGDADMPEELANHGASCEKCLAFCQRQEALAKVLPSWKTPAFSEDFTLGVMSRLAEERAPRRVRDWLRGLFSARLTAPVPAVALASLLLVASLGLNLFFWTNSGTDKTNILIAPGGVSTIPNAIPASGPYSLFPREWNAAGAFLLIPMVDIDLLNSEKEWLVHPTVKPSNKI